MQRRNAIKTTQAQYDRDAALLVIAYQWSFPHKSHRWKKFEPKDPQRDVFYYVTSTEIAVVWQRVARNEPAPEQAEEEELRMPAAHDPAWAMLDVDCPTEVAWSNGKYGGTTYTAKVESAEQVVNGVVMPTLPGVPTICAIAEFKAVYDSEKILVQFSLKIKAYSFFLILPYTSERKITVTKSQSNQWL